MKICTWVVTGIWLMGNGPLAAQTFEVIPLDQTWKYNASGTDLGQTWHGTNYDDSGWDHGPAPLGREPDPIPAPIATQVPFGPITHYFRTEFVFPTNANGWTLSTTNMLVDDGVAIYLNDQEVSRFNMPGGSIIYSSLANAHVDNAVYNSLSLLDGALREGTNILAAEVHQDVSTSRDIVWALGLQATHYGSPNFLEQPPDVLTNEHANVDISLAVADGSTIDMQWFKDNVPVRGVEHYSGTSFFGRWFSTVGIYDLGPADTGNYWAVATNTAGVVTSRVAHVDYIRDTLPPVALFATVRTNATNWLRIAFSELPELASAANPANYALVNEDFEKIPVLEARVGAMPLSGFAPATNVFLRVGEMPFGPHYFLSIRNVRDQAWTPNTMADTIVPVLFELPIMNFGSEWRYRNDGLDLGTAWMGTNFDDSAWPTGRGIFGVENNSPVPDLIRTPLPLRLTNSSPLVTCYFRMRFDLPLNLERPHYGMNSIVDDGAALYLNEHELLRVRLAANAASTNWALGSAPEPQQIVRLGPIPADLLAGVSNLLAVELHQVNEGSVDLLFGLELVAFSAAPVPQPVLYIEQAGANVVLRWETSSAMLQSAGQIEGPWETMSNATTGVTISALDDAKFFRLKRLPE